MENRFLFDSFRKASKLDGKSIGFLFISFYMDYAGVIVFAQNRQVLIYFQPVTILFAISSPFILSPLKYDMSRKI